jgi:hypothetical protein
MKKLKIMMMALMMCSVFTSCSKDEDEINQNCNCGTIANDGIDTNPDGSSCYWLEIRSECSGNKKKFCFDQDVWMNSPVGNNFCVTNQSGW